MSTKYKINKTILSWAFYDWANSAFACTVMAGFFPFFFKDYLSSGADPTVTTARLGMANSIAGLCVAILAPVLGAIADKGSAKKKFLFLFAYLGALMTTSLFLVEQGDWKLAIFCYVMGSIGFEGGNIFYDSLLSGIATNDQMDFVSSLGFSVGYLGGGILFAINCVMLLKYEAFGFAGEAEAAKFAFLTVGIWWGIFSLPIFLFVKEPKDDVKESFWTVVTTGLQQLRRTFGKIKNSRPLLLFLIAYWLYIDGVNTIVVMSVNYGMTIGFQPADLMLALLIVQFVGFPAALGFGYLGNLLGTKRSLYIGIFIYLCMSILGSFIQQKMEFYFLAICIGLVQGGVQALSRSFYGKMIPKDKPAEYFGFYNMIGKSATIIGPVLMGRMGLLVKDFGYSADTASRTSISSIAVLFLSGGFILFFVKEPSSQRS